MKVLRIRLYPDQDDKLLTWLEELDELPFGAKSQTIKETLLRGLGVNSGQPKTAVASITTNVAFDTQELLSDIRRVVEASLESALAHLPQLASPEPPSDERAEVDAILDDFAVNLMLSEEEDDESQSELWHIN